MKKGVALVLVVMILVCLFAGCRKQQQVTGDIATIQDLYDNGYACRSTSYDDEKYGMLYTNEEGTSFYKVTAKTADVDIQAIEALDFFSDTYDNDLKSILVKMKNYRLENLDSLIPTQEVLNGFVGKTLAQIEEDGFSQTGSMEVGEKVSFTYQNSEYEMDVEVDRASLQNNDEGTYVITKATFFSISGAVIE